jgi:hypothetical protein
MTFKIISFSLELSPSPSTLLKSSGKVDTKITPGGRERSSSSSSITLLMLSDSSSELFSGDFFVSQEETKSPSPSLTLALGTKDGGGTGGKR